MPKPQLLALCNRLCQLILVMAKEEETAAQADEFYAILDRVLSLPPHLEAQVYEACESILAAGEQHDALNWFHDELESEVVMQWRENGRSQPYACVLFAIGVVLDAEDSLDVHGPSAQVEDLARHLADCQVVDSRAKIGLVNRVFSATDFLSRTPGQLKRLSEELAEQLFEGSTCLRLPLDFEAEPAHGANLCSEVRLHFMLGIAAIADDRFEELFPELPDASEVDPEIRRGYFFQQGAVRLLPMPQVGQTDDGQPWENGFLRVFDNCFGVMGGSLAVVSPQGLYEDLRTAQECAREIALHSVLRIYAPENDSESADAPALVCVLPQKADPLQAECIQLEIRWPNQPAEEYGRMSWPVLGHESMDEAMGALQSCLSDEGATLQVSFGGESGLPALLGMAPLSPFLH